MAKLTKKQKAMEGANRMSEFMNDVRRGLTAFKPMNLSKILSDWKCGNVSTMSTVLHLFELYGYAYPSLEETLGMLTIAAGPLLEMMTQLFDYYNSDTDSKEKLKQRQLS